MSFCCETSSLGTALVNGSCHSKFLRNDSDRQYPLRDEPALFRNHSQITRPVQHTNDHQIIGSWWVVNGVRAVEGHAKSRRKRVALWPDQRRLLERSKLFLYRFDEACRDGRRGFPCDVGPNPAEFRRGGFGQTESERAANSFLPRSAMSSASKSTSRPAVTSAKPLSMSVFSAASSSD